MKQIRLFSASTKNGTTEEPLIVQCRDKLKPHLRYFDIEYKNTLPLAKIYNRQLNNADRDYLILCHDDLIIEDNFLIDKINEAMKVYDIVGLAGIKAPITVKPPCLWHLMGDQRNMSGAVAHFDKTSNKRFMTNYGLSPDRVIILDGVFLVLNTEKIVAKGLTFDENNPAGFHFYDIMLCLDANKLGLKCGTWPIWCTHNSHGLEKPTEDWLKGQQYFLNKYNN